MAWVPSRVCISGAWLTCDSFITWVGSLDLCQVLRFGSGTKYWLCGSWHRDARTGATLQILGRGSSPYYVMAILFQKTLGSTSALPYRPMPERHKCRRRHCCYAVVTWCHGGAGQGLPHGQPPAHVLSAGLGENQVRHFCPGLLAWHGSWKGAGHVAAGDSRAQISWGEPGQTVMRRREIWAAGREP